MMKKAILFLMVLFTFSTTIAQTKTYRSRVKIKKTPDASATDTILAIKSNGLIVKTDIAVGNAGTGFEAFQNGLRIVGSTTTDRQTIGDFAIDGTYIDPGTVGQADTPSAPFGAASVGGVMFGQNNKDTGDYNNTVLGSVNETDAFALDVLLGGYNKAGYGYGNTLIGTYNTINPGNVNSFLYAIGHNNVVNSRFGGGALGIALEVNGDGETVIGKSNEPWTGADNGADRPAFTVATGTTTTPAGRWQPLVKKNSFQVLYDGTGLFNEYGSGNFTGTPTFDIQVDANGKLIEVPISGGGGGTNNYINGLTKTGNDVKLGGTLTDFTTALKFNSAFGLDEFKITDSSDEEMFIVYNSGGSGHAGANNPDGSAGDPETPGIILTTGGYIQQKALSGLIDMDALGFTFTTRNPYNFNGYGYEETITFDTGASTSAVIDFKTKNLTASNTNIADITQPKDLITKEYADANYSGGGGATNLSYTPSSTQGTVVSDTGTNAVIPVASSTNAGLMKANFYEEGTWSPVVKNLSGSTVSTSVATGTFTRIGNIVHFRLYVQNINGVYRSISLPFSSENNNINTIQAKELTEQVGGTGSNIYDFSVNRAIIALSGELIFTNLETGGFENSRSQAGNLTDLKITGSFKTNVYTP